MPPWMLVFLVVAAYGAVHSALLTPWARKGLEAMVGPRAFAGWFRLGFNLQAVVLLAAVVWFAAVLPDVELFRLPGAFWAVLWVVRLAALAFIGRCVGRIGLAAFLGLDELRAWRAGQAAAGDGVETGELVVGGPYRRVRHPMYAAGFVALWAEPRWTENGLAFAVAASLYLWLGALHEERRLLRFYGEAYRRYMASTPRFLPRGSRR